VPLSLRDVRAAATRIRPHVDETPVVHSRTLDEFVGCRVFLKCEHLQRTGSFKYRGATNATRLLCETDAGVARRGVVTDSSGNHGAAVARAARELGIPAYVVVPRSAPPAKKAVIEAYGATLIECAASEVARLRARDLVARETGATPVPSSDDHAVIAGAGTAALELLGQTGRLTAIVVPVGGGGLLAGTLLAAASRKQIHIFGAEPDGAADAMQSMRAGHLVDVLPRTTIADGLLVSLKPKPWDVIRSSRAEILDVPDEETLESLVEVWTRTKNVIEPSAAVAVALARKLVMSGRLGRADRVGIIISGGNTSIRLARLRPYVYR